MGTQHPQKIPSKYNLIYKNRTSQDYEIWNVLEKSRPLKSEFDKKGGLIVEYLEELSLIEEYSVFEQVIDGFFQDVLQSPEVKVDHTRVFQLQYSSLGGDEYLIRVQAAEKTGFFQRKKHHPKILLKPTLKIRFLKPLEAKQVMSAHTLQYKNIIKNDQNIHKYIKNVLLRSLRKELLLPFPLARMSELYEKLISQLPQRVLHDDTHPTPDYLKEVWQIPFYVYFDDPEAAMAARVKIQRSFAQHQVELMKAITQEFFNEAAILVMRDSLSQTEIELLNELFTSEVSEMTQERHRPLQLTADELNELYQELLSDTSIPDEVSVLYSDQEYLERLATFFHHITTLPSFADLKHWGKVKDRILENIILFLEPFSRSITGSGEEFFEMLTKIVIQRIRAYHQLKAKLQASSSL